MTDSTPLCLTCNYPLHGIDAHQCPECGRAFDPSDAKSVNLGQPLGGWGRAMIQPVGWPLMLMALGAIVGLVWVTRWPGFWAIFWYGDAREATKLLISKTIVADFRGLQPGDRVFVAAVGVWWIAVTWFVVREVTRLLVLMIARPGKMLRPRVAARLAIAMTLLCAGLAVIGFGWPYRMAQRSVANYIEYLKGPKNTLPGKPPLWPLQWAGGSPGPPSNVEKAKSLEIVQAELSALTEPRSRCFGLVDLINGQAEDALPILIERAAREADPQLRIALIHLIGVYRDPSTADALQKHLDNSDAPISAAAIDALGILYSPAYPIPNGDNESWSGGELRTDPPVELRNIISLVNRRMPRSPLLPLTALPPLSADRIDMPAPLRGRFADLMVKGNTIEEREAAARAMLSQPPLGYKLRYAEWGVWLASGNDPNLHVSSSIDEIPPFVHRMGNPVTTLRDHVLEKPIIINKPVIHLTANVPMAVDLETRIHLGRPWFAYPKPDDFSVSVEGRTVRGLMSGGEMGLFREPLVGFDIANLASFPDAREGYPWLLPAHRQHDTPGTNNYNTVNIINALGVRWQSAIISPQKLPWMTPPVVPDDKKFHWWSRLRDVDCSWVSSRGEAERFLYYDGPTSAPAICDGAITGGKLWVRPNQTTGLAGLLIEVKNDQTSATTIDLNLPYRAMALTDLRSAMKPDARAQLLAILLQAGLKSTEADGLLDCWAPQFFRTPGLRLIVVFGTAEYDRLCPMDLHPPATERARVGLQLKELGSIP